MTDIIVHHREELYRALIGFAASPRFLLFKDIEVKRLMPESVGVLGLPATLTFGGLAESAETIRDGGENIFGDFSSITTDEEQELLRILAAFNEDLDTPIPSIPADTMNNRDGEAPSSNETEELYSPSESESAPIGSVPLELALRGNLSRIAAHPLYETVRLRAIGEFWDRSWIGAPFEEALSIEQLSRMDLAVLLKKRMVTDTRVQSIVKALGRVISHLEDSSTTTIGACDKTACASPGMPTARIKESNIESQVVIPTELRDPSIAAQAMHGLLTYGNFNDQRSESTPLYLALFLNNLRAKIDPNEYISFALGRSVSKATHTEIAKLVEAVIPERLRELLVAILQAPAVRSEHIARILVGESSQLSPSDNQIAIVLSVIIARALGAEMATYHQTALDGYWTINPNLLTSISLTDSLKNMDPFLLKLIEAQGSGGKSGNRSGKGEPKRLKQRQKKVR